MNIEQLEYIVEVAKTSSISIAAEKLHISQSGISQSITSLEEELGIKIFNRSRMGTYPTDEGKVIIKKAYEILSNLRELRQEAHMHKSLITGELKISVIPNMMMLLFNTLLAFRSDHPDIHIEINEKGTSDILEDLRLQHAEIGLITIPEDLLKTYESFYFEKLLEAKMKVYEGKNTPLAFNGTITTEELAKYPLVLYKSENVKQFVKELSDKYGPFKILFTTDSNDVIKRATIEGLGIGIGTSNIVHYDPYIINGDIITVDIADFEQKHRTYFGWIRSKDKPLSPAAKKFLNLLKLEIQKGNG